MVLKLIKTEKGYIAIDDKPIPYIADGGTNGHFLCLSELDYGFDEAYVSNVGDCGGCRKIVATDTSFKIDGIPQFNLEKHINPYQEICDKLINPLDALSFEIEHPLIEQMKLVLHEFRQKSLEQKNYTEEDLRIVFGLGADVQYTAEEVRKIIYFSLNVGADKKSWKLPFEYADEMKGIKELIAIEVETKCGVANPCECSERNLDCQVLKPKIIGNNLIVKEYIFN